MPPLTQLVPVAAGAASGTAMSDAGPTASPGDAFATALAAALPTPVPGALASASGGIGGGSAEVGDGPHPQRHRTRWVGSGIAGASAGGEAAVVALLPPAEKAAGDAVARETAPAAQPQLSETPAMSRPQASARAAGDHRALPPPASAAGPPVHPTPPGVGSPASEFQAAVEASSRARAAASVPAALAVPGAAAATAFARSDWPQRAQAASGFAGTGAPRNAGATVDVLPQSVEQFANAPATANAPVVVAESGVAVAPVTVSGDRAPAVPVPVPEPEALPGARRQTAAAVAATSALSKMVDDKEPVGEGSLPSSGSQPAPRPPAGVVAAAIHPAAASEPPASTPRPAVVVVGAPAGRDGEDRQVLPPGTAKIAAVDTAGPRPVTLAIAEPGVGDGGLSVKRDGLEITSVSSSPVATATDRTGSAGVVASPQAPGSPPLPAVQEAWLAATASSPATSPTAGYPAGRPALAVEIPFATAGWTHAVADRLAWVASGHGQAAELILNPPSLGSVEVHLRVHDGEAEACFFSPHPVVRETLEAALPRLREMLAAAGLTLGEASVSDRSFGRGEDSGQRPEAVSGGGAAIPAVAVTGSGGGPTRLLDLYI